MINIEKGRLYSLIFLAFFSGLLFMGLFFNYDNKSVYEKLYRGDYKLKVEEINIVGQDTSYVVGIKRVDK